jgi:hypothetical protein
MAPRSVRSTYDRGSKATLVGHRIGDQNIYYLEPGLPFRLNIRRTCHNPPRGPSTGWWVLTIANAAGTNGLTCLPKHEGAQDNKFLVTHPLTDQRCLTSAVTRQSALTTDRSTPLQTYVCKEWYVGMY